MSNIIAYPPQPKADLLVGPFEYYKVVVDGRAIPHLNGYPQPDGLITLVLDGRFAIDVPESIAQQVAWLVANALAVGQGYSHLGAVTKETPFAPIISEVTL